MSDSPFFIIPKVFSFFLFICSIYFIVCIAIINENFVKFELLLLNLPLKC
jgi:hypothetical protein